jgi:uncharacterized protein YndB with AHSA1/START domain
MITFQTTGVINASPDRVFAYISDPRRMPEWRRDVRKVSDVKGQPQAGMTYFEELGSHQLLMKITQAVPDKKLVIEGQGGVSLLPTLSFILAPEGRSTRVYLSVTMKSSGLSSLLGFMQSSRLKRGWSEYLTDLDRILGKTTATY